MKVKFIGFGGYFEVPCYKDENGKLYFDENNGRNGLNLYTGAYLDECGEICGEPDTRVLEEVICDDPFVRNPRERDYMMLNRLMTDCKYFLTVGRGNERHLYYKTVEEHCDEMEKLWNSFSESEKPEWLTLQQIHRYREQMCKERKAAHTEK